LREEENEEPELVRKELIIRKGLIRSYKDLMLSSRVGGEAEDLGYFLYR
jgi:hypothetical protein